MNLTSTLEAVHFSQARKAQAPNMMSSCHTRAERERERERERMGIANRPLLLGLALVMVLGTAVYFRLWIIDYKISAVDAELLRREFDLANKEAVDESAEWRYRFDEERERANKCIKELTELKETTGKKAKDTTSIHEKFQMLQKENKYLIERLASLNQQLEIGRLRCSKSQ